MSFGTDDGVIRDHDSADVCDDMVWTVDSDSDTFVLFYAVVFMIGRVRLYLWFGRMHRTLADWLGNLSLRCSCSDIMLRPRA